MTHGVGFLPQCDVIVVMTDGVISEMGTYTELIDTGGEFSQFVHKYHDKNEGEEMDDVIAISIIIHMIYFVLILIICSFQDSQWTRTLLMDISYRYLIIQPQIQRSYRNLNYQTR